LDSASSFHATSKKELFSSYTEKENGFAYLGDGSGYLAEGVDDIKFKLCDGEEMLLNGVKHVPGLTRNLITTTQILLHGVYKWGSEAGGLVARLGYSRQGSRASNRLG
jgi:hypothetical protein